MTPEAQKIAIAEVCGFKRLSQDALDENEKGCWYRPNGDNPCSLVKSPPDYFNDLNAIAKAVTTLSDDQYWPEFYDTLADITGGFSQRPIMEATAAQRAEAFLRTLNLWKD